MTDSDGCPCGLPRRLSAEDALHNAPAVLYHSLIHSIVFAILDHERTVHGIPNTEQWLDLFGGDLSQVDWAKDEPDLLAVVEAVHPRVAHDDTGGAG